MKEPEDYILTDKQKKHFWSCLYAWQERLGLSDWRITRSNRQPAMKAALCQMVNWDNVQRQVSCRLASNWGKGERPTDTLIEQTAVHELLHVLLHPVLEASGTPGTAQEDIDGAEHGVINRLEKLLVPGNAED
jgi:hypothetical protein